ncbi:MAG: 30S ribosomal protein S9 [Candidatus Micrarchaeota archaeon]
MKKKSEKTGATQKRKKKTGSKQKKGKEKFFQARGKRKESVARATVSEGKGIIRINSMSIDNIEPASLRDIVLEPVHIAGASASKLDIHINICGGGVVGQMQAARVAVAKAILKYTGSEELKQKMISVDRNMIIEDKRRVEPKKYKGPKARARSQKSYR